MDRISCGCCGSNADHHLDETLRENVALRAQIVALQREHADAELRASIAEADGMRLIEAGLASVKRTNRAQRPKRWEALSTLVKQANGIVSNTTVWNWCVNGKVEARQSGLSGLWEIEITSFWDAVEAHAKRLGKPFARSLFQK